MRVESANDERGDYLICHLEDGRRFQIDLKDRDLLYVLPWRVYLFGKNKYPYIAAGSRGRVKTLHREIMKPKPYPLETVDHEDGDSMNCRRYNLRICSREQNLMNKTNGKRTSSGYRGVYQTSGGRWFSLILSGSRNEHRYLGMFDDPITAAKAWDAAAIAMRGVYTNLNFPTAINK